MTTSPQDRTSRHLTLAIECAAGPLSVVLVSEGRVVAGSDGTESQAKVGELTDVVNDVLAQSGRSLQEVECVVISIGPGSYTGIRSGIAFAKGIKAGSGVEVRMIPLTYAMTRGSASKGIVGAVVRVGRNECAVEVFSGSDRLLFEVVGSDALGDTVEAITRSQGVVEWMVDSRLKESVSGVKADLKFAEIPFAELLGTAASDEGSTLFQETSYLFSKF